MSKQDYHLYNWQEIKDDFSEGLLMGNGASIAQNCCFAYKSLFNEALRLGCIDVKTQELFKQFETTDFEAVLYQLLQARYISQILETDMSRITASYQRCQRALMTTILKIHPSFDEVKPNLQGLTNFLQNFSTIISLNYDLLLYWSMYWKNCQGKSSDLVIDGHYFKDGFIKRIRNEHVLTDDLYLLRKPHKNQKRVSIVFYLHGNLALARKYVGYNMLELKIKSHDNLLSTIIDAWQTDYYIPLFVCEGTKQQKLARIYSSQYLRRVYEEGFGMLNSNLAVYGWSLGQNDEHVLERLAQTNVKRFAISVHKSNGYKDWMLKVINKIQKIFVRDVCVYFFDSESIL